MKATSFGYINKQLLIRYLFLMFVYLLVVASLSTSFVGIIFFILFQIPLVICIGLQFKNNQLPVLILSKLYFNLIKIYSFLSFVLILFSSSIFDANMNPFEFGQEVAKNRYEEPSEDSLNIGYFLAAFSSALCLLPLLLRIDDNQADKLLKLQIVPLVLYAVLGSAKYALIIPFFSYIFWSFFVKKNNNIKALAFKLIIIICAIIFVQSLRYGDQAADLIDFMVFKLVYSLFNAVHLDAWLLSTPPSFIEFNFQNVALGPASILGLAERGQGVWDTVEYNNYGGFNIYTTCRNWLSAFGILGLFFWYIYVALLMFGSTLKIKPIKYFFRGLLIMEICFFPLVSPMTYNFNILVILFAVVSIYILRWNHVRRETPVPLSRRRQVYVSPF